MTDKSNNQNTWIQMGIETGPFDYETEWMEAFLLSVSLDIQFALQYTVQNNRGYDKKCTVKLSIW